MHKIFYKEKVLLEQSVFISNCSAPVSEIVMAFLWGLKLHMVFMLMIGKKNTLFNGFCCIICPFCLASG